jgi:hypothetical protein
MHAKSAAPGSREPGAAGSSAGDPRSIHALAPHILERLAAEGVCTLADWRALGRRRFQLWGVTRAMAAQIDEIARGAP